MKTTAFIVQLNIVTEQISNAISIQFEYNFYQMEIA